jgi:hypothetical protein
MKRYYLAYEPKYTYLSDAKTNLKFIKLFFIIIIMVKYLQIKGLCIINIFTISSISIFLTELIAQNTKLYYLISNHFII